MNRRKLLYIAGISALLLCGSTVYAASSLKLIVNGKQVHPQVEPRIENGTTLVPIRTVAESLGATIEWNEKGQEVRFSMPEAASTQRRIELLQQGLAAATPDEAIQLWTRGLQTRNGAVQLASYSPNLQPLKQKAFEKLNWVTGVSSPWINKVSISSGTPNNDGTYTYMVKLDWRTSADLDRPLDWSQIPAFPVVVGKSGDNWYVTDFPDRPKFISATLPDGTSINNEGGWSETGGVKLQLQALSLPAGASIQSIVGNHSEVVQTETVQLPNQSATLALVERTAPAAAGPTKPTYEYWLIVTEDRSDDPTMKYVYSLVGIAGSDREQAKKAVLAAGNTLTLTPWKQSPEI